VPVKGLADTQEDMWPTLRFVFSTYVGKVYNPIFPDAQDLLDEVHAPSKKDLQKHRLQIPPVANGFKRSADLLKQISNLNQFMTHDYFCFDETDREDGDVISLDGMLCNITAFI
jgi:hypothetical protein